MNPNLLDDARLRARDWVASPKLKLLSRLTLVLQDGTFHYGIVRFTATEPFCFAILSTTFSEQEQPRRRLV